MARGPPLKAAAKPVSVRVAIREGRLELSHQIVDVAASAAKPRRFVFVLLDGFTMLCFACALESFRIANRMSGKPLYSWVLAGEGGDSISCSAGTRFKLDMDLVDVNRDDTLLVCGGIDVAQASTRRVVNWLRREARHGVTIGGLCTASYTLA